MVSDIWLRTILIVRKETRCRHIGYSFRLAARVLLYAPSHRQDSTYHGLCYTSRAALAGSRNSPMGRPWRIDLTTHCTMSYISLPYLNNAQMRKIIHNFLFFIISNNPINSSALITCSVRWALKPLGYNLTHKPLFKLHFQTNMLLYIVLYLFVHSINVRWELLLHGNKIPCHLECTDHWTELYFLTGARC